MNRLLLLALLPMIAVALYLEGQRYDPALIDFASIESQTAPAFLPSELDGFTRLGPLRTFTKENLYEYVNGHAEYFIRAGYVSLAVGEYVREGSDPNQPGVVVEIYDMGKGIQAFGVLADEVGDGRMEPTIGEVGFRTSQGLSFVSRRYYVKINAFEEIAAAPAIAQAVEAGIGETSDAAPVFSRFPALGTVVTTRFVKEAYRGLDFLDNVVEREFSLGGKKIQVFLVPGDGRDLDELTASFLEFFRESEVEYVLREREGKPFYEVKDPYEGDWVLLRLRDALFGIYGSVDEAILARFFEDTSGRGPATDE